MPLAKLFVAAWAISSLVNPVYKIEVKCLFLERSSILVKLELLRTHKGERERKKKIR